MMKYLKAEAEIIKFDNSDVVTNSQGCGTPSFNDFNENMPDEQKKRCSWGIYIVGAVEWWFQCVLGSGWYVWWEKQSDPASVSDAEAGGDWL